MDWLWLPIDPSRDHEIEVFISWHARLMFIAWSILFPVGIIVARFFKITPGQDWPNQVDNRTWWIGHLTLQYSGGFLLLCGLWLIWKAPPLEIVSLVHRIFGWAATTCCAVQIISGLTRGSKGGPTDIRNSSLHGDHYNMTKRRRIFEYLHKIVGYLALTFAGLAIITGFWSVNALGWMWTATLIWWTILVAVFFGMQKQGLAVDTYQAIWGPDSKHPGNRIKPIGWGIRRKVQ